MATTGGKHRNDEPVIAITSAHADLPNEQQTSAKTFVLALAEMEVARRWENTEIVSPFRHYDDESRRHLLDTAPIIGSRSELTRTARAAQISDSPVHHHAHDLRSAYPEFSWTPMNPTKRGSKELLELRVTWGRRELKPSDPLLRRRRDHVFVDVVIVFRLLQKDQTRSDDEKFPRVQ